MDWWIYLIAALNAIAAILALISKLWWTKFYRAAKEAQIEALMAQIEGLKQHNQNLLEINPEKILEFYKSAKILLEEQIASLKKKLEKAKTAIEVKERRIGKLHEQRDFHIAQFKRISQEKAELEKKAQNYDKRILKFYKKSNVNTP